MLVEFCYFSWILRKGVIGAECVAYIPTNSRVFMAIAMRLRSMRPANGSPLARPGGLWVSDDQGGSWTFVTYTLPPVYAVRFACSNVCYPRLRR